MSEKQFRFLKYYAIILTVLVGVLIVTAFILPDRRMNVKEITVEQINVVDKEGRIRVMLAGSFPPRRNDLAGLLFINQEGTEAGGLVYSGQKKDGQVSADGTLTMDQYNNDQIIALNYNEENGLRKHGLTIADRPDSLGPEVLEAYTVLDKMAEGPARDSIITELFAKIPAEQIAARRVFIGRDVNKAAIIDLSDRSGTPRLRLIVDSLGVAKIHFLDTNGYVFYTIPE